MTEAQLAALQALIALKDHIDQQQWQLLLTNSFIVVKLIARQQLELLKDRLTGEDVVALKDLLGQSNGQVSQAIAQLLVTLGDYIAPEQWQVLATGNFYLKQAAIQALGLLGDRLTDSGVKMLVEALYDPSSQITQVAAQALATLEDRVSQQQWQSALMQNFPERRRVAAQALAALGNRISQQQWQTFLTDSDWRVRRIAVFGLGALGDKLTDADIMALFPVGNDSEEQVKEALERVLGALEDRVAAVLAGIWSRMDEKKAQKLLNDSDWQKRYGAALALVARGNQLKDAYVKALLKTLAENNRRARHAAMTLLATLGDPSTKMAERMSNWTDADQSLAQLNSKHWLTRLGSVSTLIALGKRLKSMGTTALINVLNDADWQKRKTTALALGGLSLSSLSEDAEINALIDLLPKDDAAIQQAISQALAALKDQLPEAAITALIDALDDSDSRVRLAAVTALGIVGDQLPDTAITALVEVLNNADYPSDVEKAAARFLGTQGKRLTDTQITAFVAAMADSEWYNKEIIAQILGGLQNRLPEAGLTALIETLAHKYSGVREAAAQALGALKERLTDAHITTLMTMVELTINREDDDWYERLTARESATQALIALGNRLSEAHLAKLIIMLTDNDHSRRKAAAEILVTLVDRLADTDVAALIGALADIFYNSEEVWVTLVRTLDVLGDKGLQVLTEVLADINRDWRLREAVAYVLGELGDRLLEKGIMALIDSLADSDTRVKRTAAQALGRLGNRLPEKGVMDLISALGDRDYDMKPTVKQALKMLEHRISQKHWQASLTHNDDDVREASIRALAALEERLTPAGVTALVTMIADDYSHVREAAVEALIALRERLSASDITALVERLTDDSSEVRDAAVQILAASAHRLTGANITALIGILTYGISGAQQAAAQVLGKVGSRLPEAGVTALAGSLSDYVRQDAAQALGGVGKRLTDLRSIKFSRSEWISVTELFQWIYRDVFVWSQTKRSGFST